MHTAISNSLSMFYMSLDDREPAIFAYQGIDLLEQAHMSEFLEAYGVIIKGLEPSVAAAYFSSWFNGVAMAKQYFLSEYNISLDLSLGNLTLQLYQTEQGYYFYSFKINTLSWEVAPADEGDRKEWRNRVLIAFYSDTIQPLFDATASASGIPVEQLWGQMPTTFNNMMARLQTGEPSCRMENKQRLIDDYDYLSNEFPSDVFGLRKNPFHVKIRYIEAIHSAEQQTMMRNVCCMAYRTEGGKYCYSCPKLKEEDRAAMREEYRNGIK